MGKGDKMKQRTVGIYLFNNVEVLDFAGPFEVFSVTGQKNEEIKGSFDVFTIAKDKKAVVAINGLSINPDYSMKNAPAIDLLVIPGGLGSREVLYDEEALEWIKIRSDEAELVLSVCTGAFILGKIGLLDGLQSTTHHSCFKDLEEIAPETKVIKDTRFVDNGRVITAGGIAAGIDMSLHVVGKLLGESVAMKTANHMEYQYSECYR